jgi:hypothetical protein
MKDKLPLIFMTIGVISFALPVCIMLAVWTSEVGPSVFYAIGLPMIITVLCIAAAVVTMLWTD